MKLLACAVALLLSLCAPSYARPISHIAANPISIPATNGIAKNANGIAHSPGRALCTGEIDCGGDVETYMALVRNYNRHHWAYQMPLWCASACTLKLSIDKVCVRPNTQLFFHSSYDPLNMKMDPQENAVMAGFLPSRIAWWIAQRHAFDSLHLTLMTGREAIELGVRECL